MKNKFYKCKFPGCDREQPILSKGLCNYHRALERGNEIVVKSKSSPQKKALNSFYTKHMEMLKSHPYSDASNVPLGKISRTNICHILPKREQGGFPSIATNDDNIVYLSWQEHHDFDRLLDNREFDKLDEVFSSLGLRNRIRNLLDVCTERNKFYFQLEDWINQQ